MSPQALIFDCDGTLTDSMPVHYLSWHATLSRHGIVFEEERFYALGGMPTDKIIAMLSSEQGIPLDHMEIAREKEDDFLKSLHLVVPIEPVVQVVREHHGKLKMAVASGGWRAVVRRQLELIGYLEHFDTIVAAEDTELHKPEPDVFLEAARRLNVPPQFCRVYEDSDLGIEAARRAGMEWVDVRQWHTPRRMSGQLRT
ncbi:MAG TPA: HAD-IA family hydrolase [Pirellulaceae bacterium]|nr:HAD-IA family hydrolase [Pirellulaceae bacterium]